MQIEVLGPLLGLLLGQPGVPDALTAPPVIFRPHERAVSDWRWQAAANLDASPGTRAALLLGRDPAPVTRCVRLNNYWCIKRGGWAGEIAADADGHVAFVSAAEGATVAALLLRRYYIDYGRHSALAIVSHWAPASCGPTHVTARHGPARAAPDALASRGIGRTLRARWLAAHHRGFAGMARARVRVSAVPDRLIAALPAPNIAIGLGVAPVSLAAGLPDVLAAPANPASPPGLACAGDTARIRNYAVRAAAGIAGSTNADLALFDAEGRATPHLAALMRNMAAVEIGPLGAREGLVAAAVAHAAEVVAARRAALPRPDPASPAPGVGAPSRIDEARRPEP